MFKLNTMTVGVDCRFKRKIVGRGMGTGLGKTCGRGHKGQGSRSGFSKKIGFEGGQMPMYRRIPKRGMSSFSYGTKGQVQVLSVKEIFNSQLSGVVTLDVLKERGLVGRFCRSVKVVASMGVDIDSVGLRFSGIALSSSLSRFSV